MSAAADWFEDDRLWVESYPTMFPEPSFETARREVDSILELAGCRHGRLLDLACGPGRHAVPLALRGFEVTGVDRSRFLLEKARAYGEAEGVALELLELDMRELSRPSDFDLALCMFSSFGLFDDEADNRRVLENVHRSLAPGGTFVVDVMGKEILARIYQPTASTDLGNGRIFVQRRRVRDAWTRMEMDWLFLEGETVRYAQTLRHFIYSGRELRDMLRAAGFANVAIHGNLRGDPYGPEATRLVAVARKR